MFGVDGVVDNADDDTGAFDSGVPDFDDIEVDADGPAALSGVVKVPLIAEQRVGRERQHGRCCRLRPGFEEGGQVVEQVDRGLVIGQGGLRPFGHCLFEDCGDRLGLRCPRISYVGAGGGGEQQPLLERLHAECSGTGHRLASWSGKGSG